MKDLINDEEEEVEEDSDEDVGKKKRRHDDFDDNLEDEDYDLIEENLGVKVQRKKKFKRVRRIEDEESDNEDSKDSTNRDAIANELFEGSDAGSGEATMTGGGAMSVQATYMSGDLNRMEAAAPGDDVRGEGEEEEREASGSELESDPDDFIVDDDGQPITKGKKKRHIKYTDSALQEAQDIFGVDFDFDEFSKYQDEYDEEMEEEEYEDEEEEGEARPRPKKTARKRPTKKSIFEVYEPVELERGHFTDRDNEIRATDIPERFQLRAVPVTSAPEDEISREAEWIYKHAFGNPTVSVQTATEDGKGAPASEPGGRHQPPAGRKGVTAIAKIAEALKFMRNQLFEVRAQSSCSLYVAVSRFLFYCLDHSVRRFPTAEEALKGARYMVAVQISMDPLVRRCIRETFFERAKICVTPSKKGLKEIDENHPCYPIKYLKNKPVRDLEGEQFLHMSQAEGEGLLKTSIVMDSDSRSHPGSYLDEIKQLYYRDEFSNNVQEWNNQRCEALSYALSKLLYPAFEKELKVQLLLEAQDGIVKACCRKLYNWLKVAPYQVDPQMEEDEDFDTRDGIRVFAIAYENDWEVPAFGALIDGTGEVMEHLRLPHLLKRKNSWKEKERELKEHDMRVLRKFILNKKPHVICVGAQSREALQIVEDIKAVVTDLAENEQMPLINVELLDNDLAIVYMNSKKAESDFRDYPLLLRQAISLARRMQDPLVEFSQLCTPDEEIFCLKYHPLQDSVPRTDFTNGLNLEFVNRTNEVGVDINLAIAHTHTSYLVQFLCGLGPRKGYALLKTLKQSHQRLESRTQLVTVCHMGPKVFINCAGFIKIDTTSFENSTNAYVEVLDGSRVHPEAYEWARKMAVDALEYDDVTEDVNPAEALEEILENPEKLRPMFLRAGKMVTCQVVGIARRKPHGQQLDQANPIRNDETGLWQCPFCLKNDFPELSEVWNHFDAGSCPGQSMGVRVRLDNGVNGFIHIRFISDKKVTNPEERVRPGMILHCRIIKIDIERFAVDLTCRSSDLADVNNEWSVTLSQSSTNEEPNINSALTQSLRFGAYVKRVIVHPSFHNISYKEAEKLLSTMDQGDVIIRPSSKGVDHLTVTWKVHEGILQHIDVKEQGKENAFSLGSSLLINNEEFEDLDEIIARHVQPMAGYARDLTSFRYFREAEGGKREVLEKLLAEEKKRNPSKIHYVVSSCREFPGKFLLSYLPRVKARHEYITVTPDGYRYRQQMFHSVGSLFRWFKEHFRDPVPGTPGSATNARTPMGQSSYIGATPSINISNVDPQAIQRAAANIPSHMFASLSQVAGQTPSFTTPYGGTYANAYPYHQPYTPSQAVATPMVTPSYHAVATPSQAVTPRYPQTPQTSWGTQHPTTPRGAHTPRHTPSAIPVMQANPIPTVVSSGPNPMVESTPQGDATPLIDEQ
ncbi:S1 RNA binding domain-containing protein, putative [Ixodes scapularis]|uniref:S1 RNA binding domain-containing protein, putative n=1 Tax=Ixodes scapularis TaxID=6945 RepID=B7Q0Q9_IXOSC|nr:S1 RNA binding domain-containing protein, putative [Ixodes scapularis]|eukprot:XP_002408206.1 S1 RNA binding domain-containing protein, putative [Ixodes scapularis]